MTEEQHQGRAELRVEPVPLRRRGRLEPAVFVAIGLVTFVGAAMLKPWAEPNPSRQPVASPRPSVAASQRPVPSGPGLLPSTAVAPEELAAALKSHGLWGVAAIGKRPSSPLAELWAPIEGPPPTSAEGARPSVFLGTAGYSVQALVITSPPGQILLLGRSWRLRPGADPEPLTVRPFRSQVGGGPSVLIPPPDSSFGQDRWLPGTYRFEVVLATATANLTVVVIGRASGRRV
jgi:hypothetical protein